jgi:hypothetical protein
VLGEGLLDLAQGVVGGGLGVEGHFAVLFGAGLQFLAVQQVDGGFAGAGGLAAAGVVDDVEGTRRRLLLPLNLHQ